MSTFLVPKKYKEIYNFEKTIITKVLRLMIKNIVTKIILKNDI